MIEKLTSEQEKMVSVYREKWLEIGLTTKQCDFEDAKRIVNNIREKILGKSIVPIVLLQSPLSAWVGVCLLSIQVWDQVWAQVGAQVRDQVRAQVWDQVRDQVGDQVGDQVRDQVRAQVGDQVRAQVWDQVGDQVRDQVGDQVRDQVGDQVREFIWPYLSGHFWATWLGYYDYMIKVIGVMRISDLALWSIFEQIRYVELIYPLQHVTIVSQPPIEIHMKNKMLHADGKPSILYADGFSIWSLNGVRVTKEIAETQAEKLNPKLVLTEKNAEVRREIVRKIGIERVIQKLRAKCLDKLNDYELLEIKIPNMRTAARYLKMRNPSIGTWHVEGVPPEIKNCQEALNWRIGGLEWNPGQLT